MNPLTASSDIARAVTKISTSQPQKSPIKPTLGSFADDVLKISTLGLDKQQKEIQIDASNKIEDVANEVIRISSSIGRAKAIGNLTYTQAINLYNKISHLR
ncbi:hypothetical protein CXF85_20475 [Colwellia sp. 75C3]|nr:hypothetical protein CXF85_20475 [Colwellia sp. 75C3]